jgi:hypothetical protein
MYILLGVDAVGRVDQAAVLDMQFHQFLSS